MKDKDSGLPHQQSQARRSKWGNEVMDSKGSIYREARWFGVGRWPACALRTL